MSIVLRRILLAGTAAIGLFVGGWAALAPETFYTSFPGLGRVWVVVDGPYNEHLIRDVGALYLALAAGSVVALVTGSVAASRTIGVAWIVFSVPHLAYHLHHLDLLSPFDAAAQVLSLSSTILLGIPMLLGGDEARRRQPAEAPEEGKLP